MAAQRSTSATSIGSASATSGALATVRGGAFAGCGIFFDLAAIRDPFRPVARDAPAGAGYTLYEVRAKMLAEKRDQIYRCHFSGRSRESSLLPHIACVALWCAQGFQQPQYAGQRQSPCAAISHGRSATTIPPFPGPGCYRVSRGTSSRGCGSFSRRSQPCRRKILAAVRQISSPRLTPLGRARRRCIVSQIKRAGQ